MAELSLGLEIVSQKREGDCLVVELGLTEEAYQFLDFLVGLFQLISGWTLDG